MSSNRMMGMVLLVCHAYTNLSCNLGDVCQLSFETKRRQMMIDDKPGMDNFLGVMETPLQVECPWFQGLQVQYLVVGLDLILTAVIFCCCNWSPLPVAAVSCCHFLLLLFLVTALLGCCSCWLLLMRVAAVSWSKLPSVAAASCYCNWSLQG